MSPRLVLTTLLVCLCFPACKAVNSALGGNSEEEAVAAMKWGFAARAITLQFHSVPKLNVHDGQPHTLVIAVVQMEKPAPFQALVADPAALAKLLASGRGDPALLQIDRFVIEPAQSRTVPLDRAEGAQMVGVVAGYFQLDTAKAAKLFRIGIDVTSKGWTAKTRTAMPTPLALNILLGSAAILNAEAIPPREASDRAVPAGPVALESNGNSNGPLRLAP